MMDLTYIETLAEAKKEKLLGLCEEKRWEVEIDEGSPFVFKFSRKRSTQVSLFENDPDEASIMSLSFVNGCAIKCIRDFTTSPDTIAQLKKLCEEFYLLKVKLAWHEGKQGV